ncbi:MMPL family transporter [Streptomyces halobius]|uniref:MMPL family transporter n=1 Tax=Streptomyces halobius TaxID=2879846 RepID=A0ABY4M3F7_9ACTN|nr:MMPL family transporter [Streptomyces halobius]UQA90776.1 MMPL family transporter [Streptomyces halobius]
MPDAVAETPTDRPTSDPPPGQRAGRSRLAAFARSLVRRRIPVLLATLVVAAVAVPFAVGVAGRLSSGGFTDPAAQSAEADEFLAERFGAGVSNLVLLARAPGSVDDPAAAAAGRDLTLRVARMPGVLSAGAYWTTPDATPLRARNGRSALVLVRLGGGEDEVRTTAKRLVPRFTGRQGVLRVSAAGRAQVAVEIQRHSEKDLLKAEAFATPFVLLILLLVFGSAVAAALPLLVGLLAVLGTFLVLRVLSTVTSVSVFATNITTALGLGLAVDYSLFIITRYREELARGRGTTEAIAESVRTAGRTVLFSALTVALSLTALLVFPLYFLRSLACAGMAVVALAALAALVVLPAALALLGPRSDALDMRPPLRRLFPRTAQRDRNRDGGEESGFWHRLATRAMRRPVLYAVGVVGVLVVFGLPFGRASFGLADDRVLPADAAAHRTAQQLREQFASRESGALSVVLPAVDATGSAQRIDAYAAHLSGPPDVARVDTATGSYERGRRSAPAGPASARFTAPGATWLSVVPSVEPYSAAGTKLVQRLRTADRAPGAVLVGGEPAQLVDTRDALASRTREAALIIGGTPCCCSSC